MDRNNDSSVDAGNKKDSTGAIWEKFSRGAKVPNITAKVRTIMKMVADMDITGEEDWYQAASGNGGMTADEFVAWADQECTRLALPSVKKTLEKKVAVRHPRILAEIVRWAAEQSNTKEGGARPTRSAGSEADKRRNATAIYDAVMVDAHLAKVTYRDMNARKERLSMLDAAFQFFTQRGQQSGPEAASDRKKAADMMAKMKAVDGNFVFESSVNTREPDERASFTANRQHTWFYHQLMVITAAYRLKDRSSTSAQVVGNALLAIAQCSAVYSMGKGKKTEEATIMRVVPHVDEVKVDKYLPGYCLTVRRISQMCGMVMASMKMGPPQVMCLMSESSEGFYTAMCMAWNDANRIEDDQTKTIMKDGIAHVLNYVFTMKEGHKFVNLAKGSFLSLDPVQPGRGSDGMAPGYSVMATAGPSGSKASDFEVDYSMGPKN